MKSLLPEEEWARQLIELELGAQVEQHDDGSEAGMYDLRIVFEDGQTGAVEVVAAGDPEAIEWWNLANGSSGRWTCPDIQGGWMVVAEPSSSVKRLKAELPKFLSALESQSINSINVKDWPRADNPETGFARTLGIVHAIQSGTDYPGSIYLNVHLPPERSGGFVSESGDPLAEWVGNFLSDSSQADVSAKLDRSLSDERHAFIILPGFSSAPFSVFDLLIREDAPLPGRDPTLPMSISHVWVVSTWSKGMGFRWAQTSGWSSFRKLADA